MSSICHIQRDAGQAYAVRYGDHTFRFRLGVLNAAQKAAIHVHPDGDLEVEAPAGAPLAELKAAVQRRARWVLKHLAEHNHSPRFYRLLDDHMPDWRTVKQRLDEQVEVLLG